MQRKLLSLDIETECAVQGCTDSECKHALDPHKSKITVIGLTDGELYNKVFRGPNKVADVVTELDNMPAATFTAHNGKFDVKFLIVHGAPMSLIERWEHDSSLLAFTYQDKIPAWWLDSYEEKRRELNSRRNGTKHRPARQHSLKTLAPYFLDVEPFWEPEHGHDDDAYVLKDAVYSLNLTKLFLSKLDERSLKFYQEKYLPWTKNLLAAELKGVRLDLDKLEQMQLEVSTELAEVEEKINAQWAEHFEAYIKEQEQVIDNKYKDMLAAALAKSKKNPDATVERYEKLAESAKKRIQPLNLASPTQLRWLLTERLGLDARNLAGEESTDKETLNILAERDASVAVLLRYRELQKLNSAFLPEYKAMHTNGRIYTTFNVTEARTGRLSSSTPNMQQVPGDLHDLFIADDDHVLITRDLSAIEPTMLAYYSEDKQLCDLLIKGGDFHSTNAAYMFQLDCDISEYKTKYKPYRNVAKTVGLAVLYGAGKNQVHITLIKNGLHQFTLNDAARFVTRIRELYAGVWEFKRTLDRELERGATIFNYMGRPYSIPDASDVYMKGLNTLIQSSASDLLQQAAYDIKTNVGVQPLLLVHDELVCQVPKAEAETVAKLMDKELTKFNLETYHGRVPIKTEGKISRSWEK